MNSSTKIISRYIAVMLVSIGITAITLSRFSLLLQSVLAIPYDWEIELCIVVGQLLFQLPFIWKKSSFEIIRYNYTILLISLLGSVILWPIIGINMYDPQPLFVNIIYFFTVVGIMFLTHMHRVKKLQLPHYLCYTWVLYRLLLLPFILNY